MLQRFRWRALVGWGGLIVVIGLLAAGAPWGVSIANAGKYASPRTMARPTVSVAPAQLSQAGLVQYQVPSVQGNTIDGGNFSGTTVDVGASGIAAGLTIGAPKTAETMEWLLPPVMQYTQESPVAWMDPSEVLYSQRSAGGIDADGVAGADKLRRNMATVGWSGTPVEAVRTPAGVTVLDNTRPAIAQELGIKQIAVRIHDLDEILPTEYLNDPWLLKNGAPRTWGDFLKMRIARQGASFPVWGTKVIPSLAGTPLTVAEIHVLSKGQILVQTDAMLARRLAPFIEKLTEVSGKIMGPIERIGQTLAAAFPAAAAKGQAALAWITPYAAGLGKVLGVVGIIIGLLQMGYGAKRIYELIMEHGLGVLGTKEGAVAFMETLAAALETLSAAAAVAALVSSATVVGGLGFGALSLLLLAGGLALRGTAWLVENWDNVMAFAQEKLEAMKDAMARGYAWVKDNAGAVVAWGKEQVGKLAAGTKHALQRAGQWFGEQARGLVTVVTPVVEKVIENVPKVVEWVEEKATTIWKKGVRMVEKIVDVAKDILEPVVRTGKRMVMAAVDVVRQIPRTVYDVARRMVDRVVPVVRQVTDWVTDRVSETYRYATTVTRNVTEWVTQRVQEAYEVVKQVPRQVKEWVTERVQEAYQVARTVSRAVKEWVTERVQEAYTVARTVWETVTEWIPQQVRSWFGWFWKWVTKYVPIVKQVARTVYETAYRWVDKSVQVARTVYDTVYDTAYRWVDKAKQVTKTVYDTVRETAYRWVDKPVQAVRQVAETVWNTGSRIVERIVPIVRNVTDYITQKVEETYEVARTVYDTVVEKVPQLVEEAYTYVEQVPKRIVEKVSQLVPEEFEYPETVVEKITQTRTDIVPVEREVITNVTAQVEGWVPR